MGLEFGAFQVENWRIGAPMAGGNGFLLKKLRLGCLWFGLWISMNKVWMGLWKFLECWVMNWKDFDGGGGWNCRIWKMMNSDCRGNGVEYWRWAAMVVLMMMIDEEKGFYGWQWVNGREVLRELKKELEVLSGE